MTPTGLEPRKFDSVEDMVSYAVNFTEEGETGTLTNEGNGNFGFTRTKVTEPSAEDKAFMEANGGGTLMPSVEVTGETLHVRQGLDRAWSASKTYVTSLAHSGERWAAGEGGQAVGQLMADFNPLVSLAHLGNNALNGANLYGQEMSRWDVAFEIAGFVPIGRLTKLAKLRAAKMLFGVCFVEGTLVYTEEGLRPIETVRGGDLVWAKDEKTGKVALKTVSQLFVKETRKLVILITDSDTLLTTPEHPFWSKGTWRTANQLAKGDTLLSSSNAPVIVRSKVIFDTVCTVYNFEVSDFHTYFVGLGKVWVHNDCGFLSKKVSEFTLLHTRRLITSKAGYKDIRKLSDEKLIESVRSPTNGDFVTISESGRVIQGNTRLYELKRRGLDIDVPYEFLDSNNSDYFFDLD